MRLLTQLKSTRVKRSLLALVFVVGCLAVCVSPAAATGTGAITGTVTNNAASPKPLANICVQVQTASTGTSVGTALTEANGQYTVSGLATGSYKLAFYDCSSAGYVTQYYNNKPSWGTATSVSVTAPSTTAGINAEMALGGKLSGTVTNSAAVPVALAKICVTAYNASTGSGVGSAVTNASGQYTIGLPTGSYKVKFSDCSALGYVDQYYNNQPSYGTATSVSVTAPATTSAINAKMKFGAKITGTVTDNAAVPAPLAKMCVAAIPAAGGPVTASAATTASGTYTIRALPTGSYKVEFYDCNGTNHVTQYYNNKPTLATATSVSATAPATLSGINAKLALGGKITGTVTDNAASPAPLANICVNVLTTSGSFVTGVITTATGQYTIAGVPVGSYKVVFSDCGTVGYVTQYYNNKPSLATANVVSVITASTTAGINSKMARGGKISGTVTNNAPSPAPLANICVDTLDPATGTVIANATTNASGQYTIGKLAAGSYKVEFIDCGQAGYTAQYYKNQPSFATANPVSVTAAVTTTAINAKMVHS